MAQLSDSIEQFIKDLMEEDRQIDLKRNELAQHFGCAPSQINYVLATRFSIDHGYVIESRRGGGGYVRIIRIQRANDESSLSVLLRRIGRSIDEDSANAIISQLLESKIVTRNEALLMRAGIAQNALALPVSTSGGRKEGKKSLRLLHGKNQGVHARIGFYQPGRAFERVF
ncbi:MAG: CtsR family transcriptional regulator [Clostridiales bacterium]|nr:CtsR family transcriptional regulator [Clostridiales bacterium]